MRKKMNNKGQVLIIFLALIPILIAVLTIATDLTLITYNKKKLNGVTKTVLNYIEDNKEDYSNDAINKIIHDNDKDIIIVKIEDNNDKVTVILNKSINTIFGNIIGIKTYSINSKYILDKKEDKIIKIEE